MIAKKKIEPSVVSYRKYAYGVISSKIRAPNLDAALSYFKGRYGLVGKLVKANSKTTFTIKGKEHVKDKSNMRMYL